MEIEIRISKDINDLHGILRLQEENLPENVTTQEAMEQGFVTIHHSLELLETFQKKEPQVIALVEGRVVAYILAMTKAARQSIPLLIPMFNVFDEILLDGRPISSYSYLVVGQVCVSKEHRGKKLFDRCYEVYREVFKNKYDVLITEISDRNPRSIRAHERVGFQVVHRYPNDAGGNWVVVLWDWRS